MDLNTIKKDLNTIKKERKRRGNNLHEIQTIYESNTSISIQRRADSS